MSQASEQTPLLTENNTDAPDTTALKSGSVTNGHGYGNGHTSASKPIDDVEANEPADVLPTARLATIVPALVIGVCSYLKYFGPSIKESAIFVGYGTDK